MRHLTLPCGLALSVLMGVLLILTPVHAATTITVTTTSDAVASDGMCSLREAIIAANTDSAYSDCPAGAGADTIVFDSGLPQPATFVLTNTGANEDSALTGDLDIVGALTIHGAGRTIIDGNGTDRVFQMRPGAQATLDGITVRHGNPGSADGGAIAIDLTAHLTMSNTTIISNTALGGGGIKVQGVLTMVDSAVTGNQGGGISNDGGQLTLRNVNVLNNKGGYGIRNQNQAACTFEGGLVSGNQGGGIYNATSSASLNDLTIVSNAGSGAHNEGASPSHLTLSRSTVMTNTSTSGAGVFSQGIGAIVGIYDTRISGNIAAAAGGGVFNNGIMTINRSTLDGNHARSGGGIEHFGGTLSLTNATLSGNSASDNGGGLYNESNATLRQITLAFNSASGPDTGGAIFNDNAQLSITNSIVAHSDSDGNCFNSGGLVTSLGYNLDSANTCGLSATGDITDTNPLLGSLRDNGGATPTHALLSPSLAIDAGDCSGGTISEDQRGVPRPQGPACDIGAFELSVTANLSILKTVATAHTPVRLGDVVTYTVVVANSGDVDAAGVHITDTLPAGVTGSALGWTGPVTAGQQVAFLIPAVVTTSVSFYGQTLTNTAYYSHTTGRGLDSASFTIARAAAPDLSRSAKTSSAAHQRLLPGDLVTFTLTLENSGGMDATVAVTDVLESYYVVYQAMDLTESPTGTLAWHGTVATGHPTTLQFVARVAELADLPTGRTTLSNTVQVDDGAGPVFSLQDMAPPYVQVYDLRLPVVLR